MLLDDVPGLGVFRGVAAARVRAGFSPLSDEGLEFTARIGSTLAERPAVLALYPTWRPDAAASCPTTTVTCRPRGCRTSAR